ncbi:MAG TPA: hypothetical protein VI876_07720 [Dehalococcoidia bacterium]|nr:hypothetical protein [Dehalococcoidia bacterium]
MTMGRIRCVALVVCVAAAAMLTLACSSTSNPAGDDAALDQFAPKSESAAIKAVSLGTSSGDSFDPKRTGTEFPEGTDRIVVWYRWSGADKALQIDNVWYQDGDVVLEQGEAVGKESGDAAWLLKLEAGGALPEGGYEVRLLEDGRVVTTIPFKIGN